MARINLTDSLMDVMVKLCDGNPGALRVCMEVWQKTAEIDPDSALGGLGTLLSLDTLEIYGPRIWMLYKDVCKEDLVSTVGLLRGHQLGYVTADQLYHAIDNYGDGIDVSAVLTQVREYLPAFAQPVTVDAV